MAEVSQSVQRKVLNTLIAQTSEGWEWSTRDRLIINCVRIGDIPGFDVDDALDELEERGYVEIREDDDEVRVADGVKRKPHPRGSLQSG